MNIGVVGGGVLGLTLGYRLARAGHRVKVIEAAPQPGGLATWHDFELDSGETLTWDRFYHCILPQDERLLGLIEELGLREELRWTRTGTGYTSGGKTYSMSGNRDFFRFPLLGFLDKARLGWGIVRATRFTDPLDLYDVTAAEWLSRICGRRNYEVFWQPLLRAKLGDLHDRVAAVFIWATLTRLFGARKGTDQKEKLGYVRGGYSRIIRRLVEAIEEAGGEVVTGAKVRRIARVEGESGAAESARCSLEIEGSPEAEVFDQVLFTAPTRLARELVDEQLRGVVDEVETAYPTAGTYLGVLCMTLVLDRPLTPYYVLNIADERVELTGLIEVTNLIDREAEFGGKTLIYLPRYLDSRDPAHALSDEELEASFIDRGLSVLFPSLERGSDKILHREIQRARWVQPLPLVGMDGAPSADHPKTSEVGMASTVLTRGAPGGPARGAPGGPARGAPGGPARGAPGGPARGAPGGPARGAPPGVPGMSRPFQPVTTAMLRCATLNNDEVLRLVDEFLEQNPALSASGKGELVETEGAVDARTS